ncbi:hypothetical protein IV417_09485 [Alphaproteobacteria bacterium KMM 3653]|uniref:Uncharacterized protein n=1 Tax=Harenicola maris TaxID=2841044 RepID=A0AAP2CND2_9RHOB|nr:hypothetical protein [Harenicola maris]
MRALLIALVLLWPGLGQAQMRYSEVIRTELPEGMTLPAEIAETMDWLEAQGYGDVVTAQGLSGAAARFVSIYPPALRDAPGASYAFFNTSGLRYTQFWEVPDPALDARLYEIAAIAGDGGRAALWLDDAGKQWIVSIGHDEIGVISDDPKVFLAFLAIGYAEPAWLSEPDASPMEIFLEENGYATLEEMEADYGEEVEAPIAPEAFRAFLEERFDITVPQTAAEIGLTGFASYGDLNSDDPFAAWVAQTTPPPTQAELDRIAEVQSMAEKIANGIEIEPEAEEP